VGEVRVAFPGVTSPAAFRPGQDASKDRILKDNDGRMQRIVDDRFSILSVLCPFLPPFPPSSPPCFPLSLSPSMFLPQRFPASDLIIPGAI
jgi:hypothetical protein